MTIAMTLEVWFVTGSNHFYGEVTLIRAQTRAEEIARCLGRIPAMVMHIVIKPLLTAAAAILALCRDTNNAEEIKGLAIAGADRRFYSALARVENSTIIVSSHVPHPVAVRYARGASPFCNLVSAAGGPAAPFLPVPGPELRNSTIGTCTGKIGQQQQRPTEK